MFYAPQADVFLAVVAASLSCFGVFLRMSGELWRINIFWAILNVIWVDLSPSFSFIWRFEVT